MYVQDGTIKLWNFLSCRLLQSIDMKELWQQQQSSHLQDQVIIKRMLINLLALY